MGMPKAYAALKEQERLAGIESAKRSVIADKEHDDKEKVLYNAISNALKGYNNSELDGHKVQIIRCPIKNTIQIVVDKFNWVTFEPEWHWYGCSCEAPWEHGHSVRN